MRKFELPGAPIFALIVVLWAMWSVAIPQNDFTSTEMAAVAGCYKVGASTITVSRSDLTLGKTTIPVKGLHEKERDVLIAARPFYISIEENDAKLISGSTISKLPISDDRQSIELPGTNYTSILARRC